MQYGSSRLCSHSNTYNSLKSRLLSTSCAFPFTGERLPLLPSTTNPTPACLHSRLTNCGKSSIVYSNRARSAATRNHAVAAQPKPLRRSTRFQTAAAVDAAPKPDNEFRVLKTTKRKPERYDCTTCDRNLSASSFPKYLPTDKCKHLINTCKTCTKKHIAVMMDSVTYDKLACPECPEILTNADVKREASKDVYKRYDELERRGISEKVPGWRWCLNPNCRGGQVHKSLLKQLDPTEQDAITVGAKENERVGSKAPQTKRPSKAKKIVRFFVDLTSANLVDENDQDIFTCNTCGHRACVPCDRPFHEGETCAQYKARLGQAEANSEKSQKTIEKYCKPCPKCGKKIEKNGGCDAMYCPCGERFCWLCLVPYATINATGHAKDCRYAAGNNRFDPHAGPGAPGQPALW